MTSREVATALLFKVRAYWLKSVEGWSDEKIVALTQPPADWIIEAVDLLVELLQEADDLVPRISSGDPMAPALADWLRDVRDALKVAS